MLCAGELDWVAKLKLLSQYRDRDGLDWDDAKLHLIDLQYSDIRPEKGLYAKLVAAGRIERLLDDASVERAMHEPPEDTRAYFRGRCLEKYADNVAAASWDSVIFDLPGRESLQRVPTIDPCAAPRRTSASCSTAATPPSSSSPPSPPAEQRRPVRPSSAGGEGRVLPGVGERGGDPAGGDELRRRGRAATRPSPRSGPGGPRRPGGSA